MTGRWGAYRAGREQGRPRVAAIVLAAGASSRTAPAHKLLAPDATGLPMIARTLRAVAACRADPLVIVFGHRSTEIQAAALRASRQSACRYASARATMKPGFRARWPPAWRWRHSTTWRAR
ncbi:NTP transferase domain-containing protein [Komagataeibacter rhaeticus]|nr:NTP transferase domain-containing protein [Komagataeibacter rhaeticus]